MNEDIRTIETYFENYSQRNLRDKKGIKHKMVIVIKKYKSLLKMKAKSNGMSSKNLKRIEHDLRVNEVLAEQRARMNHMNF